MRKRGAKRLIGRQGQAAWGTTSAAQPVDVDKLSVVWEGKLETRKSAAHAIDYYYIAGSNLDEVIAGYRQLTGKAVMLPRRAYGFWRRWQRHKSQAEILNVVREYHKRGIPLDNIVEDWH
jgi:alpha-D-xyloside xylohydrolase